ncbi:MAG: hypothetical protein ACLRM9_08880 [Collinsella aerofaciens]
MPANTSSPALRSTASGSPVRVAWLTMALPCSTTPSMQMDMPVRGDQIARLKLGGRNAHLGVADNLCALSGTSSSS